MRLEAELAPGVVLVDVSKELPRATKCRRTAEGVDDSTIVPVHKRRRVAGIKRVYVHHSGSVGAPGLRGAINSARYVVERRGFHCCAYHYWIPEEPVYCIKPNLLMAVRDKASDPLVVYRANLDSERCWHTGGKANTHGIGVCLQGNKNERDLTDFQKECLEALLPWCARRFFPETHEGFVTYQLPKNWLATHSGSGPYGGNPKKACPGKYTEKWLKDFL